MSTNKKLEIILLISALFIYISCDKNIHIIPHIGFIFKTISSRHFYDAYRSNHHFKLYSGF